MNPSKNSIFNKIGPSLGADKVFEAQETIIKTTLPNEFSKLSAMFNEFNPQTDCLIINIAGHYFWIFHTTEEYSALRASIKNTVGLRDGVNQPRIFDVALAKNYLTSES